MTTRIAIYGASGRMGVRLIDLVTKNPELELVAAIVSPNSSRNGQDAGVTAGQGPLDLKFTASLDVEADVVIDFSTPEGADQALDLCLEKKTGLVLATTRLDESTIDKAKTASHEIPIVWSPNMSLAVNLTMRLAETAAQALKNHSSGVDVEIIERHHRFKADSPSGTALKFGELIAQHMEFSNARHGREGMIGERPRNEIGYHAIRAGDDPGQHTILFGMLGETIELRVAASNRDCYALGAIEAARFLVHHGPGLYSMYDVLGLKD